MREFRTAVRGRVTVFVLGVVACGACAPAQSTPSSGPDDLFVENAGLAVAPTAASTTAATLFGIAGVAAGVFGAAGGVLLGEWLAWQGVPGSATWQKILSDRALRIAAAAANKPEDVNALRAWLLGYFEREKDVWPAKLHADITRWFEGKDWFAPSDQHSPEGAWKWSLHLSAMSAGDYQQFVQAIRSIRRRAVEDRNEPKMGKTIVWERYQKISRQLVEHPNKNGAAQHELNLVTDRTLQELEPAEKAIRRKYANLPDTSIHQQTSSNGPSTCVSGEGSIFGLKTKDGNYQAALKQGVEASLGALEALASADVSAIDQTIRAYGICSTRKCEAVARVSSPGDEKQGHWLQQHFGLAPFRFVRQLMQGHRGHASSATAGTQTKRFNSRIAAFIPASGFDYRLLRCVLKGELERDPAAFPLSVLTREMPTTRGWSELVERTNADRKLNVEGMTREAYLASNGKPTESHGTAQSTGEDAPMYVFKTLPLSR